MKNAFYFILKALFVKVRLISNSAMSQPGYQTITYSYYPISHELKTIKLWNLGREYNITK